MKQKEGVPAYPPSSKRRTPRLDGDAMWERILKDDSPRKSLSLALDEVEPALRDDPARFPETTDDEFKRRS